jgi:ubiquitin carboxyl-terminal hydrolase 7
VYKSFAQYIEEETLEGDNKYQAEGLGYQDAKKGCIFMSLPPVLMLHLKRFEYDVQRDMMYKINDRYDFPTELDLSKYLADDSEQKNQDNTYMLFSVLVHSGDVSGGHYYAFIKAFTDEDQWYKFDDERVYKVHENDAVFENYGGAGDERKSKYFWKQTHSNYKKYTNAYMLVYIRKTEAAQLLQKVDASDVPEHLQQRFEQERAEKERRKLEKAEAWKYCSFRVACNQTLGQYTGSDLLQFNTVEPIKIKKDVTIADLKKVCEEKYGIPADRQRFWKWEKRQNKTYRPDAVVKYPDHTPLDRAFNFFTYQADQIVNLYLEESTAGPDEPAFTPVERDDCLLFFKFYDPVQTTLTFIGTHMTKVRQTVGELIPVCNEMLQIEPSTPLQIFEEVRLSMVEPVSLLSSLRSAELQSGDILIFQHPVSDPTLYDFPTVKDYFSYLVTRIQIKLYKWDDPKNCIEIELLKNMKYETVVAKIGAHEQIGVPGQYIRLTGHNTYGEGSPKDKPFKTTEVKTLKDMISAALTVTNVLYYEILEMPLQEIENKKVRMMTNFGNKF